MSNSPEIIDTIGEENIGGESKTIKETKNEGKN